MVSSCLIRDNRGEDCVFRLVRNNEVSVKKRETDDRDSLVESVVKWRFVLSRSVVEFEDEAKDFIGEVEKGARGRR